MHKLDINRQKTLATSVVVNGKGVHSGKDVALTLHPADINSGIVFLITDERGVAREIPALGKNVCSTQLCTVLGEMPEAYVATIEHIMAAAMGFGVDNLLVEVEGREIPALDGSSEGFVDAFEQAGIVSQHATRRYIKVLKPVRISEGEAWAEFTPYEGTRFDIDIDFECAVIGRQRYISDLTPDVFKRDIARARTFGFMREVESLWAAGYALGSSLENSVVIGDDERIVNSEGLRYSDEFARHKLLDAIGDLSLAGAQLYGCYRSYRGGHRLNALALRALLEDKEACAFVGGEQETQLRPMSELAEVAHRVYAPMNER